MNRKKFLKIVGISAGTVAVGGAGVWAVFDHKTTHQPLEQRTMKFISLAEAYKELEQLEMAEGLSIAGQWSLYQNIIHCAQSIEFSYQGFPKMKPAIFQRTLGALAWNRFNGQGYMTHDLNDPIPDAPIIDTVGETRLAFERLKRAIEDFEAPNCILKPHFAYGNMSKSDYAKAHAMHLADHFSAITLI